jgi:hypothetical protein
MTMRHLSILLVLLLTASSTIAAEPVSENTFHDLHSMIKPQPGEWKWAEVPWRLSVKEARKTALETGRPLVIVLSAQGSIAGCL